MNPLFAQKMRFGEPEWDEIVEYRATATVHAGGGDDEGRGQVTVV